MTVENTSQRDPLIHLLGAMSEGSDHYIEGMEAQGQRQFVNSQVLPVRMGDRAEYEALGFTFGEPVEGDRLFVNATLPDGWEKRPSDHSMWSHIYDADGNERVAIFYKAAFYDRDAFMRLVRND
jgi:hypothetical protein